MKPIFKWLVAIAALFALVGCGGGGSGGSGSGGSGSFFLTDNLNTGYDHVWVTIKEVSLGRPGGGSTTVFSDATGVSVDLKTLRDGSGKRFRFLCLEKGLSGQYDSISVVLDDDLVLYPTGATTGLNRVFAGSSGGSATLTTTFATRTFGPGNDDLIIDFDLSNWTDDGTNVTASIVASSDDNGLHDENRHEHENYPGTLSNLQGTAPDQSFTLTHGQTTVTVQCDSNTRIDRSGGNGNPVLANGLHVVVRGIFDPDTNKLMATRVKITGNQGGEDEDEARGTALNINSGAGTLDLTVIEADEFMPAADPIHIATTGSTVYRDHSGAVVTQTDFFAALANGDVVEAEGQYDSGSNTLTATKLKLEHEDGNGGEDNAEVKGSTSLVDSGLGNFTVAASEFSGLNVAPGTPIAVHVTGSTVFKSGNAGITSVQFFTALTTTPGLQVEVEGHWDGSVLTATKCKLENED